MVVYMFYERVGNGCVYVLSFFPYFFCILDVIRK